jgi:hypothetical protein
MAAFNLPSMSNGTYAVALARPLMVFLAIIEVDSQDSKVPIICRRTMKLLRLRSLRSKYLKARMETSPVDTLPNLKPLASVYSLSSTFAYVLPDPYKLPEDESIFHF